MTDQKLTALEQELAEAKAQEQAIQQRIQAAERAARAAKRAEEQRIAQEKHEAFNKEQYKSYKNDADKIVKEVDKLGYKLEYEAPNFRGSCFPNFKQRGIRFTTTGSSGFRSKSRPAVRISSMDTDRIYPLKKDGTFSYAKIAAAYVEEFKRTEAWYEQREKKAERFRVNSELRKHVLAEMDLNEYSSLVNRSNYHTNRVDINLRIPNLTGEDAIKLLRMIEAAGIELK